MFDGVSLRLLFIQSSAVLALPRLKRSPSLFIYGLSLLHRSGTDNSENSGRLRNIYYIDSLYAGGLGLTSLPVPVYCRVSEGKFVYHPGFGF